MWQPLVCRTALHCWPWWLTKNPRFLVVVVQVGGGFVVCPAELIRAAQSNMLSSPSFFQTGPRSWFIPSFFFFFFFPFVFPPAALDALRNIYITPQGQIWEMKTSQRRNSHTHTHLRLEFVHVAIVALDGVSIQKMIFEKSFSLVFFFFFLIRPYHRFLKIWKIVDMRVLCPFFLSYSVCVYTPISILSLVYIYRAWLAAVKPFGSMSIRIFPLHVPT